MSCEYDWEQADKAMAEELKALGIEDTIEPLSPEEIAELELEDWYASYGISLSVVEHAARKYLTTFCPVCGKDCGEPEYEPADFSVGIMGDGYYNECPEHGEWEN